MKHLKKLVFATAVLALVLGFASCKSDDDDDDNKASSSTTSSTSSSTTSSTTSSSTATSNPIAGNTYTLTAYTIDGEDEFDEEDAESITFKTDGTWTGGGYSGTYTVDTSKATVTIVSGGESDTFTYSNNGATLKLSYEGDDGSKYVKTYTRK